jgi:hypothetical protein
MRYKTFDCKFYELENKLIHYSKDGYTLHSFCVLNSGFNEKAYVVVERRGSEKAE